MKALSIKQPWAWFVFHGKPVENRTWKTIYRGPLLIHASKTFDHEGFTYLCSVASFKDDVDSFIKAHSIREAATGYHHWVFDSAKGIIGRVNMTDCVTAHESKWFFGPYGFVFENQREFKKPIPFKGKVGIFNIPDREAEAILKETE